MLIDGELQSTLRPAPGVGEVEPYAPPRPQARIDLKLDGNEGFLPDGSLFDRLAEQGPELLQRYPAVRPLELLIAEQEGVESSRVLVTAGADEALDRICRAVLAPGRQVLFPTPTFEMIPRYTRLAGAQVVSVPWHSGPLPVGEMIANVCGSTAAIVVVSPNNPTGAVATASDLAMLADAAPQALVIVDLAYGDFADHDLTASALALPNAIVVRSLSKSWGLAGLRVGYAIGPARMIRWLRACGSPYSVSAPSITLAVDWLRRGRPRMLDYVERVRHERMELVGVLNGLGASALPSQANFVLARFPAAGWVWQSLVSLGILVRRFPNTPDLGDALRITCPGDAPAFNRLTAALGTVLAPQSILFDLDGVVADVSGSYRRAIVDTCLAFGANVTAGEIAIAKARGDANNDWLLTQRLLRDHAKEVSLDAVTECFETLYQGTPEAPGLRRHERLIPNRAWLDTLSRRFLLAVVTGRPRMDAERFLREHNIRHVFSSVVCMEDGPAKPDPAPVRIALRRLGVDRAWLIGDTPDDVVAARSAGVVPIGIRAPGDGDVSSQALIDSGAACVLNRLEELERLMP
ncbi:MAG: aminotransferase class I/II-fold pyridoxal phosphate-dependent enzyme [Phycisphaerales bacterium]|nr:aminotransferase class I/II-fold pyridoxal phosphate-dependent enzyme [Phycisphaerales bacterium]